MSDPSASQDPPEQGGTRQSRYRKRRRAELREHRELVGGVLVSIHPDVVHGTTEGYDLFACRCDLCTKAGNKRSREGRDRQRRELVRTVLGDSGLTLADPDGAVQDVLDTWRTSRGHRRPIRMAVALRAHDPRAGAPEALAVADAIVAALAARPAPLS